MKLEEFIEKSQNKFNYKINDKIEYVFDYSNINNDITSRTYIKLRCKIHNYTFDIMEKNHISSIFGGCKICERLKKNTSLNLKSYEDFIKNSTRPDVINIINLIKKDLLIINEKNELLQQKQKNQEIKEQKEEQKEEQNDNIIKNKNYDLKKIKLNEYNKYIDYNDSSTYKPLDELNFNLYEINEIGLIRNKQSRQIIRPMKKGNKLQVNLQNNNKENKHPNIDNLYINILKKNINNEDIFNIYNKFFDIRDREQKTTQNSINKSCDKEYNKDIAKLDKISDFSKYFKNEQILTLDYKPLGKFYCKNKEYDLSNYWINSYGVLIKKYIKDNTLYFKMYSPILNEDKYLTYHITYKNLDTHFRIHRLVAKVFLENGNKNYYDNNMNVDHINGNKLNNHKDNLRWTTIELNNKLGNGIDVIKINTKTYDIDFEMSLMDAYKNGATKSIFTSNISINGDIIYLRKSIFNKFYSLNKSLEENIKIIQNEINNKSSIIYKPLNYNEIINNDNFDDFDDLNDEYIYNDKQIENKNDYNENNIICKNINKSLEEININNYINEKNINNLYYSLTFKQMNISAIQKANRKQVIKIDKKTGEVLDIYEASLNIDVFRNNTLKITKLEYSKTNIDNLPIKLQNKKVVDKYGFYFTPRTNENIGDIIDITNPKTGKIDDLDNKDKLKEKRINQTKNAVQSKMKKVVQCDLNGNILNTYESVHEAGRQNGNISLNLNDKTYKTNHKYYSDVLLERHIIYFKGYFWKYVEDLTDEEKKNNCINILDENGNILKYKK